MKIKLKRSLLGTLCIICLGSLNAHAQSNLLNLYNCNGIQESVPPNPPGMTYPAPGLDLTICGPNLQYAQQVANSTFAPSSVSGWQVVGQCSLLRPSFSLCTAPGRI
jgi:hypothetical protein